MNPWDGIIPEDEQRAYMAAGFGRPSGVGRRPALLIIDVQYRTVGTTPRPFFEAIKEFPTSCGEVGWQAVAHIQRLLALFRARGWPVVYPHVSRKESFDAGRLASKVPALMTVVDRGYEFVAEIAPRAGDILLPKKHPSAFFGTPLASYLIDLRAETKPPRLPITIEHFPIEDLMPGQEDVILAAAQRVRELTGQGLTVGIYCQAGVSRTSTVAIAYLVLGGVPLADALAHVRRIRPQAMPALELWHSLERLAGVPEAETS